MTIKRLVRAAAVVAVVAMGAANATTVTLSESGTNFLELRFTVPVQSPQHNALSIGVTSSGGPANPAYSAIASLFDGATLPAQSQTTSIGARYATTGSFFSPTRI